MDLRDLVPLAVLSASALTCAALSSPGDLRLDRARAVSTACDASAPGERAARVLGHAGLLGVEPLTAATRTVKGYPDRHLVGARLAYAAPAGVTPSSLQRELLCHQSDVVLGHAPAREDDPYAAADEWLEIEVGTADGALVVEVRAQGSDAAAAAVDRARRLLGAR